LPAAGYREGWRWGRGKDGAKAGRDQGKGICIAA